MQIQYFSFEFSDLEKCQVSKVNVYVVLYHKFQNIVLFLQVAVMF